MSGLVYGGPRLPLLLASVVVALLALLSPAHAGEQTIGVLINEPGAYNGYTLVSNRFHETTYLIDNEGRFIHSWPSGERGSTYLLEDGSLLIGGDDSMFQGIPGSVRRYAWDGTLLWDFTFTRPGLTAHHDIELLPNGNVLMIYRQTRPAAQAISAGRDPNLLEDGRLESLHIIEVRPTGLTTGDIVWEWRAWDHLVQEIDLTKENYGIVADHPELIDVNFIEFTQPVGGDADWHHANSIDYNADFDQVLVSVRHFSEIWVIDHGTTTEEAAGHSGGNRGRGGDLLYRWGNPLAYGAGEAADQQLFSQHDAQWIEEGLPGEGNILTFNNGNGRQYSSIEEIESPVDASGNYALVPGQAYGPTEPIWSYVDPTPTDFFASFVSGAVRLPNGNTLVNDGPLGTLFEVTPGGQTVWRYVSPVTRAGPLVQGSLIPEKDSMIFRPSRYSPDYPGLVGRDLTPGLVLEADSDGDGLSDLAEIEVHGTEPLLEDSDGDGWPDGAEVQAGTDPLDPDSTPQTSTTTPAETSTTTPTPLPTPVPTEVLPTPLPGDANCDGGVNSIDAALVLQHSSGLEGAILCELNSDVNGDRVIDSVDALIILQFVAGLLPSLAS